MTGRAAVLDLGSSKAVCLIAELGDADELKILAHATAECRGVRKGIVTDLDEAASAIDMAVRAVQRDTGLEIGSLTVAIGGSHVESQTTQGFLPIYPRTRPISRDDVMQVVNHSRQAALPPDREQIQAIPREFRVDGQRGVRRPIGLTGARLEVTTLLVSAQTTHIRNLDRSVAMGGRKVEQVVPKGLASGLAVLTDEQMEIGAAVLDIGAGSAELAVFSGGSLAFLASIPVGGGLVTSDISKLLKTSPEEAERLKIEQGSAWAKTVSDKDSVPVMQLGQIHPRPLQRKVLCEIIESRVREMARMARQQIEKSGYFAVLPGGLTLTGGGSLLPGSNELFQSVLQHVRVQQARPKFARGDSDPINRPELSTAVGLAEFCLRGGDDELVPARGASAWKDRVRTLWSYVRGHA